MQPADVLVAQQLRQQPHEHHRRRRLAAFGALVEFLEELAARAPGAAALRTCARGTKPPSALRRSRMYCVSTLSSAGTVERRVADLGVGDRHAEAGAERSQFVFVELLLLVGDVLAFAGFAEAVALDRPGEDDGRRALVLDGGLVGVVDLHRIVAAERHLLQLVVAQVLDHLEQPRIDAPEVLADVGARLDGVLLILAVDDLAHALDEQAVAILGEQRIPLAAPEDLDDVPAGAAERGFELLDDLAVAADRAVEALQVAVDDEDQVVELLARGQRDRAERFGLVGFAVAEERPDLRSATSAFSPRSSR